MKRIGNIYYDFIKQMTKDNTNSTKQSSFANDRYKNARQWKTSMAHKKSNLLSFLFNEIRPTHKHITKR